MNLLSTISLTPVTNAISASAVGILAGIGAVVVAALGVGGVYFGTFRLWNWFQILADNREADRYENRM